MLTRHLVWRQSRYALISPGTSEIVLVSEILPALPADTADEVERDLLAGLEELGAAGRAGRLDAGAPTLALD